MSYHQRLIDAALICPRRPAALQEQRDAFERQLSFRCCDVRLKLKDPLFFSWFDYFGPPSELSISDPAPVLCPLEKEIDFLLRRIKLNRVV